MSLAFLSDQDLRQFAEGTHPRLFDKLGAHPVVDDGVQGVHFCVWAPNAREVSVIGEFNGWAWGAHPLTDMVWALGDGPQAVPVEFRGTGKFGTGLFDAPYDWKIEGRFANGATFHYVPGGDRTTVIGERGRVHISRGGLTTEPASLASERIGPDEKRLLVSDNHMGNFITAVRTRQPTVAPVEAAFLSDSIIQLSMIAIWTGRTIRWDPAREAIRDDSGAAQLLVRALRPPWHL